MFRRLANLVKGFVGLFIGGIEKRNPEALLEVEKENLRKNIAQFNQGLAAHAGLCERLMAQVRKEEKEQQELRAKASANLKAGNRQVAAQYALRLQSVTRELEENREQLADAEKTYRELLTARDVSIKEARAKIDQLKRGLDDMKVKTAMAELNEMAAGMVSDIGGSGDTLNRLEEMVEEERTKAAGRSRVARDSIDVTDFKMMEAEQKALEDQALADFAAMEGLSIGDESPSAEEESRPASSSKSMGPSISE